MLFLCPTFHFLVDLVPDDLQLIFFFFLASLGQVYKGRLKENGDLVAVKVQRPFVLETVTVDLFVIRNLGLFLRKFPQASFRLMAQCIVLFHHLSC